MESLVLLSSTPLLPQRYRTKIQNSQIQSPDKRLLSLIKSSSHFTQIKEIHAQIIRTGSHQETHLLTKLIAVCSSFKKPYYASLVFHQFPNPNVFHWTSIIIGLIHNGLFFESIVLFKEMLECDSKPNNFTFCSILKACAALCAVTEGKQVHSLLIKSGSPWDVYVNTALVNLYGKCEQPDCSRQVFDKMSQRNLASQNAMIFAYSNSGDMKNAESLFLNASEKDFASYTSMIMGYGRLGETESARKIFDEMPVRNLSSWNSMISVYNQNGPASEALALFSEMQLSGFYPNELTLASVLSASTQCGFSSVGRTVHSYMVKLGIEIDAFLSSGLIDMYAKCGFIDLAHKFFLTTCYKNLGTWNSMIFGFATHGKGEAALETFSQMEVEGMKPNDLTFIGVLHACSHSGLVLEGCLCFSSMVQKHKMTPKLEHYSCLVDLLGRFGYLKQALSAIESMPIKPDVFVWGSLLNACRIHSNMDLGKYALDRILELDPQHSGGYVLLSNIYSSIGQWDRVSKVRTTMKDKVAQKKTPGCSWIEVNNVIHRFFVGDRSHPQAQQIYEKLECLTWQLMTK